MDTTSLPPDDRPPVARPRRANRGLLWAAALAVVVLTIATVVAFTAGDGDDDVIRIDPNASDAGDGGSSLVGTDVTGQALPALSVLTFDGEQVPLRPDGKPLLVNFWASTCGPCVSEMPALEGAFQANGSRVDVVGVQVAERAESGTDMIRRTGVTYPMGRDPGGEVFQAFGGSSLPRTAIVAADGTVEYVHTGALDQDQIQSAIDRALGGG